MVAWLAGNRLRLALSTITIGELAYGIAVLPDGARRAALHALVRRLVAAYADRMFTMTERATWEYGTVMARARAAGRPIAIADGMIAAIAAANGFTLATRNWRDFEALGLTLVDPWAEPA